MEQLIRFNNDYNCIAQKNVLKALMETADEAYPGYGTDLWCEKASGTIRALCKAPEAAIHFLPLGYYGVWKHRGGVARELGEKFDLGGKFASRSVRQRHREVAQQSTFLEVCIAR